MIDQDTLATYERDGVAVLRRVLSPDWVARLAVAADLALADPHAEAEIYEGDRKQPLSYGELQVWKRLGAFRDSIFEGSLAKRSSIMMKSRRAQFFYDQLLVKEPGAQKRTPWHQELASALVV
jgi:ectoine hydroxylase-related dioxygenase (phytanoyl-CoA dioxygenase family)